MRPRVRLLLAPLALSLAVAAAPLPGHATPHASGGTKATDDFTSATPPQTKGLPDLDKLDPVKYAMSDAITEWHQVTSRDGVNQIWVDIIRPKVPDGVKVPTIMMASPYFNTLGRGYLSQCKTPHQANPVPHSPLGPCDNVALQTPFPEWYDEYFVPRGYAFAAMDLRGTRNTSGCQTYGAREEIFDAVDTVDWISEQPWSNGKVGMT